MLNRIFLVCLLFTAGSSLTCRWMDNDFNRYSESSLALLNTMVNNLTNSTEAAELVDAVAFPNELYRHASKAPPAERLSFAAHVLDEIFAVFEEDRTSASWNENTVDDFLNVITQQADGLRSCVGNHHSHHKKNHKKLTMYFKRLSQHVLKENSHSAEAWELIREEVRLHLHRVHTLATS